MIKESQITLLHGLHIILSCMITNAAPWFRLGGIHQIINGELDILAVFEA